MLKQNLWNDAASRIDVDQRAREARIQIERVEQYLLAHLAARPSWLRRTALRLSLGLIGKRWRGNRTSAPLSGGRQRHPQLFQNERDDAVSPPSGRPDIPLTLACRIETTTKVDRIRAARRKTRLVKLPAKAAQCRQHRRHKPWRHRRLSCRI